MFDDLLNYLFPFSVYPALRIACGILHVHKQHIETGYHLLVSSSLFIYIIVFVNV